MVVLIRCNDVISDPRAMKYVKYLEDTHQEYILIGWDREGKIINKDHAYYYYRIAGYNVGGLNAVVTDSKYRAQLLSKSVFRVALHSFLTKKVGMSIPDLYKQKKINDNLFIEEDKLENVYPTIFPNWDRTPRSNDDAILVDSNPEVFGACMERASAIISHKDPEHRLVFLKSWNEWGEGNYVEPDLQYGKGYIEALKSVLNN